MFKKLATSIALSAAVLTATVVTPGLIAPQTAEAAFNAPMFKQNDAPWGDNLMGGGATIADAGCAITSIAMALRHKGIQIAGEPAQPGRFNTWLKNHNGYSGNSIIWGSVENLNSRITHNGRYYGGTSLSAATLRNYLNSGNKAVIANVRNGSHWVLLTNHNGGTTFNVNDPDYSTTSYTYGSMTGYSVYTITN